MSKPITFTPQEEGARAWDIGQDIFTGVPLQIRGNT